MSWLSDLFDGGKKKTDFGSIYKEPPQLRIDDADVWLRQLDDLISNWDKIKTGESMFDAVKFIYEPQKAELQQLYGINAPGYNTGSTGDLFARSGSIPRVMGQMNRTGTLDAGTAGLVTGQLESQMNQDLASLFGQAKQTQRDDYMNSLSQLQQLYPERFQVRNINNVNDYNNAVNSYNVATQRNAATEADRLQRLASTNGFMGGLIGTGADAIAGMFGIPTMGMGQKLGAGIANTGMSTYGGQTGGGMSGIDWSSLFGGGNRKTVNPNDYSSNAGSSYNAMTNPFGTGGGANFGYQGNAFNPSGTSASLTPQTGATNPVNKTSSGMDFAKLLQSMMSGANGASSLFA
jgi:hypothetical protein